MFISSFLIRGAYRLYKFAFAKRTILFVTNEKIRSITLSPFIQAGIFLALAWVWNLFAQSLQYDRIISDKSQEISKLKAANSYFEEEFSDVNDKLKKVNEYLLSIAGKNHVVKAQDTDVIEKKYKQPAGLNEEDLSRKDKHTLNYIKDVGIQMEEIQAVAQSRIKRIENAIAVTGLNMKRNSSKDFYKKDNKSKEAALNNKQNFAQGGPANDISSAAIRSASLEDNLERHLDKLKFTSEIDYLMVLERIAEVMPFSEPMKNYYVSSGFGVRADPITHRTARHQGLDFVGPLKEKVISPSAGIVILAGKFSDYGNAIVINHGFGVTTRYGHLSEVKVKVGQRVKQGDVIATQGSTGRSTGSHLHYEVRYKDTPLNPKRFLEAGDKLFNEESAVKYVNS